MMEHVMHVILRVAIVQDRQQLAQVVRRERSYQLQILVYLPTIVRQIPMEIRLHKSASNVQVIVQVVVVIILVLLALANCI
jgi:hypothetical protein